VYDFYYWIESLSFSTWLRESGSLWSYPIVLTLHTVGLGVLFGFNLAVDLRLLGVAPEVSLPSMQRFFPVMWWGFWINLVSGVVLLMADATTKMTSWVFGVKMLFVVLGVIVLRRIQASFLDWEQPSQIDNGRRLAMISIACWVLATTAGRMMAYLGPQVGLAGPQVH
jgi:hypothetical protein